MVIDEIKDANGHEQKFPRYLIYDIVKFKSIDVGQTDFERRLLCIQKEIIGARHKYIGEVFLLTTNIFIIVEDKYLITFYIKHNEVICSTYVGENK